MIDDFWLMMISWIPENIDRRQRLTSAIAKSAWTISPEGIPMATFMPAGEALPSFGVFHPLAIRF